MLFRRIATFLLTMLILFADSGQTIYAHTCLKTKHKHISIGEPKHCCVDKKEASHCEVKKAICCEVSSKYLKQDFITQQTDVKKATQDVAVVPFSQLFLPVIAVNAVTVYGGNSPPVTLLKSDNTFTQSFRI